MSNPTYQGEHNLAAIARGDTVAPWSVVITRDGVATAIASARCKLVGPAGDVIPWACTVATNVVSIGTLAASATSAMDTGDYSYDLEVTYPDGRVRTYLRGTMTVTTDRAR